MRTVPDRVSEWVDVVADLLQQPAGVYPVEQITGHLRRTFDSPSVSFNWRTEHGTPGLVVPTAAGELIAGRPAQVVVQIAREALGAGLLDDHPLVRWFAVTGRPDAWSMGRVPAQVAGTRAPELLELFDAFELRQQLSVPVVLHGRAHEAFVVTRPDACDFTDDDVEVARRAQVLLRALRVQVATVAQLEHAGAAPVLPTDLTGRELAVLGLLVRGCTATAIGHRLGMSPRTATKHIEHIYRKLHVRDRVTATVVAHEMSLVTPAREVLHSGRPSRA